MRDRRRWAGVLILSAALRAQVLAPDEVAFHTAPYEPPPPPGALRAEVNLVEVPVVVRDGRHNAIPGLQQADFQVFDSGKKQEITTFAVESSIATVPGSARGGATLPIAKSNPTEGKTATRPRFIILCFDNVTTPWADMTRARTAATRFIKEDLAEGDSVAIVTTATPRMATFTADRDQLLEAINKISAVPRYTGETPGQCPRITPYAAYLIVNHMDPDTLAGAVAEDMACKKLPQRQAVEDVNLLARVVWEESMFHSRTIILSIGAMVDVLGKMPGRRMLLLTSGGFLTGNVEYDEEEAIHKAIRAEVVINALDAKGLYTYNPGGRPIDAPPQRGNSQRTAIADIRNEGRQAQAKDDGMAALALGTGGSFYHNSNDLDRGYRDLATIPETVYILGFTPPEEMRDGRFHNLKVKLASGHYSVQTRLGYTARDKNTPVETKTASSLDREVTDSSTPSDVPSAMTLSPVENGTPGITAVIHVAVGKLNFQVRDGRHLQKLVIVTALMDDKGTLVTGVQGKVDLALKEDSFNRLAMQGIKIPVELHAPPGAYKIRAVIQEATDGKMSAYTQAVQITP